MTTMLIIFLPFFIVLSLAVLIPLSMMLVSSLFGPRSKSIIKDQSYECGVPPLTTVARGMIPVKFFLIAMLFLVFDIEIVFLYPWAVVFQSLGVLGMVEMGLFMTVLIVGLIYVWKKGALEWE